MKSKRGQGLPMNTIVIAAIVLIVLVVIIMIFTGSMGTWLEDLKLARESKECKTYIGTDKNPADWLPGSTCPPDYIPLYNLKDADIYPGQTCCMYNKKIEDN